MEENAEWMLVIIGATPEGKKELIGFQVGLRESAQIWHELLTDIKGRGLSAAPEIAVGDGAMGFWNALDKAFPSTKHQRCWVHKIKNVLNCFPKQMAAAVKSDLDDIQHAETRSAAKAALEIFTEKYKLKYEKGVTCLAKDREAMLAFLTFQPTIGVICAHQIQLRASSPRFGTERSAPKERCHKRPQS
jgi:transposase-like protein